MEIEVRMPVTLPDGTHVGKIVKIEATSIITKDTKETIPWLNIWIESENQLLTYGCSQNLSPKSKLGVLVSNFQKLEANKKIDVTALLQDKTISFLTMTKSNGYSEIVVGSIKPTK